jgi:hypothetical protein
MDNTLPFHIKLFNDKVKVLNQTNGKFVTLNPQEARSLHAEIYDLMAIIAELTHSPDSVTTINMDGGSFK